MYTVIPVCFVVEIQNNRVNSPVYFAPPCILWLNLYYTFNYISLFDVFLKNPKTIFVRFLEMT